MTTKVTYEYKDEAKPVVKATVPDKTPSCDITLVMSAVEGFIVLRQDAVAHRVVVSKESVDSLIEALVTMRDRGVTP